MEFLRFEWKKLILPFILIILFFSVILVYKQSSNFMDNYICIIQKLSLEHKELIEQNSSLVEENKAKLDTFYNEKIKPARSKLNYIKLFSPIHYFFNYINPIHPDPCESSSSFYCKYYIKKTTYNCIEEGISQTKASSLFKATLKEYKPINVFDYLLSTIILFIEGYLISSIFLSIYRKIFKKDQ